MAKQIEIEVTLERVATGSRRTVKESNWPDIDVAKFMYADGNYSCDCNRAIFFGIEPDEDDANIPCGDELYRVELRHNGEVIYTEFETENHP